MNLEQIAAGLPVVTDPRGLGPRSRRLSLIEDYLFIGGGQLSARVAAARLGVTERTITRIRATLRRLEAAA